MESKNEEQETIFQKPSEIRYYSGRDINNNKIHIDLEKNP